MAWLRMELTADEQRIVLDERESLATSVRRRSRGVSGGSMSRLTIRNVIAEQIAQAISEIGRILRTRRLRCHRATIPPLFRRSERDGRVDSPSVDDR